MLTFQETRDIVDQCHYPGVVFQVKGLVEGYYLQIRANVWCSESKSYKNMSGRKWLLSGHMTETELVQTAFLALRTWLEHEAREQFTYMGTRVFSPHIAVAGLVDYLENTPHDKRPE